MTPIRQRMIEDMRLRNFSPHTWDAYVRAVAHFAKHFRQPPQTLTAAHVRQYMLRIQAHDPTCRELPPDESARDGVAGLQRFASDAEHKGLTVGIAPRNAPDHTHPRQGRPGEQAGPIDDGAGIVREVGFPRGKRRYDMHQEQAPEGDGIRRLRRGGQRIGPVRGAGNPGRGERANHQEHNRTAGMTARLAVGGTGSAGPESICPRDPMPGLAPAGSSCALGVLAASRSG